MSEETKYRNRTYVVDFDDYCDAVVDELEVLKGLRERYPTFVCTLFTIPARTSPSTIQAARELGDWVKLAPHGYFHTRGECLGWSKDEAVRKIEAARSLGIGTMDGEKCFRAPAWLLDADVYDAADDLDVVIASHREFRIPSANRISSPREYVYNDASRRRKGTRAVHGHLTPVAGNYIRDMLEEGKLSFGKKHKFLNIEEAAK